MEAGYGRRPITVGRARSALLQKRAYGASVRDLELHMFVLTVDEEAFLCAERPAELDWRLAVGAR